MQRFLYSGPVCEFGKCISSKWEGQTTAPSAEKARSNLIFQFKKQTGRAPTSKITLPGTLIAVI